MKADFEFTFDQESLDRAASRRVDYFKVALRKRGALIERAIQALVEGGEELSNLVLCSNRNGAYLGICRRSTGERLIGNGVTPIWEIKVRMADV